MDFNFCMIILYLYADFAGKLLLTDILSVIKVDVV